MKFRLHVTVPLIAGRSFADRLAPFEGWPERSAKGDGEASAKAEPGVTGNPLTRFCLQNGLGGQGAIFFRACLEKCQSLTGWTGNLGGRFGMVVSGTSVSGARSTRWGNLHDAMFRGRFVRGCYTHGFFTEGNWQQDFSGKNKWRCQIDG